MAKVKTPLQIFTALILLAGLSSAFAMNFTITEPAAPVFPTLIPDQAYVIKDNVEYKLYYGGNDFASINLAQSPDGVTWTPYAGNPIISDAGPNDAHADVKYYDTGFPGANKGASPSSAAMNYRMWYQGRNGNSIAGWRYSESPDGIAWYNRINVSQYGPPVFDGAHASVNFGIASVVYTPGAPNTGTDWVFRVYANVQWNNITYNGEELVVMGFSSDGYNWTGYDPRGAGYATPIFMPTHVLSDFDCNHIGWFKVIKNSPTDWEAFYSGGRDTTYKALNGIGYATSDNGINWTRRQALFTTNDPVAWRNQSVWMPSVVKTATGYDLWFIGSNNTDIDSSDWIQWKLGHAGLTPIPYCGDGSCKNAETCSTCPSDCGACDACGDGTCSSGETCNTCSEDCGNCKKKSGGAIHWAAYTGPTSSPAGGGQQGGGQTGTPTGEPNITGSSSVCRGNETRFNITDSGGKPADGQVVITKPDGAALTAVAIRGALNIIFDQPGNWTMNYTDTYGKSVTKIITVLACPGKKAETAQPAPEPAPHASEPPPIIAQKPAQVAKSQVGGLIGMLICILMVALAAAILIALIIKNKKPRVKKRISSLKDPKARRARSAARVRI